MDKFQNKYRIPSARLPFWNYGQQAAYFITICTHNRENFFGDINDGQMYLNDLGNIVAQEWVKTVSIRPDMNLHLDEFVVMPNHFHGIVIIGDNQYNSINHKFPDRTDHECRDAMNHECRDAMNIECGDAMDRECGDAMDRECRDAMHRVSTTTTTTTTGVPKTTNDPHTSDVSNRNTDGNDGIEQTTTSGNGAMDMNGGGNKFGPQSKNLASIVRGFKSSVTTHARKMGNHEFAWQPRFHDHIIRDDASFERIQSYIRNNPLNWRGDKFFSR